MQELITVQLASRHLALFLACIQFFGYAICSYGLTKLLKYQPRKKDNKLTIPFKYYAYLSILRAIDVGMSNLSMMYMNYPAKTLIKSSRVAFTMITGVIIGRKRYSLTDYVSVFMIVIGLTIFLHADARGNIVFQPVGICLLTTSLMCDGIINNYSEVVMKKFSIEQDRFLFHLYSLAFITMFIVTLLRGELAEGILFLSSDGTWDEITSGLPNPNPWTRSQKLVIISIFSTAGLLGSSCAAALTKHFGALIMSISSTVRKALTLFLSLLIFKHKLTVMHVLGIAIFLSAMIMQTFRAGRREKSKFKEEKNWRHRNIILSLTTSVLNIEVPIWRHWDKFFEVQVETQPVYLETNDYIERAPSHVRQTSVQSLKIV